MYFRRVLTTQINSELLEAKTARLLQHGQFLFYDYDI